MLHLITGRAGSGKTTALLHLLRQQAEKGSRQLILIVPEQYSFVSERNVLQAFGSQTAQNIHVLSFSRLADFCFRLAGEAPGSDPGDSTRILYMLRAISSVQDRLQFYRRHITSVPLARRLVETHRQLRQASATPEQLGLLAAGSSRPAFTRKMGDLALIYTAYDAMFLAHFPEADRTPERLCRLLDETHMLEGYSIAVDGFKGFTQQELEILKRLFRQCSDVWVSLCTEDPFQTDAALLFPAVNETAHHLLRIAKEEQVKAVQEPSKGEPPCRFRNAALVHLEQNFLSPTASPFEGDGSPVVCCGAPGKYEEARYIAAEAHRLVREEGYRCREIAVIVRQEEDYHRELLSAFRQYGLPVYDDTRQPVEYQPLIVLCRTLLDLACGFSTADLLRYLKTGLSPLQNYDAAQLENYILLWDLKGSQLRKPFTANPFGYGKEMDDDAKKQLQKLNALRETVLNPLEHFLSRTRRGTFTQFGTALFQFLTETSVPEQLKDLAVGYADTGRTALANEQNAVWNLMTDLLSQLAEAYGEEVTDIRIFANLFQAMVSVSTLGSIPQSLDEIAVGSADRIRPDAPRAVFVAGCAEGIFPASVENTGLLTAQDRDEFSEKGLNIGFPDDLVAAEERFTAYTAVTAASERVYISYSRMAPSGESLLPSVLFTSVKALFPHSERRPPEPLALAETPASAYSTYAELLHPKTAGEQENAYVLRSVLEQCPETADRLPVLDRAAARAPFRLTDRGTAEKLFGTHMGLSASRVDVYHQCPFRYFCQYGLQAVPRKPARLDPAQSGTVIHYVLEHLIRELGSEALISMTVQERHAEVDKWLSRYLDQYMGGSGDKSRRFRYLYFQLARTLYDIIDRLCAEFAESDFVPTDFELKIGGDEADIPAYHLDLEGGASLDIYGSVDRVDTYEKDGTTYIRVVDYKTGGKDFALSDVLAGLNMQMLIYLFAIGKNGEKRYGLNKPAGILYYPARRNPIPQHSRSGPTDEERRDQRKANCGSGLFLLDSNTLTAMEHDLGQKYIPIKQDKKGNLTGNLITAQNLGSLNRYLDDILCRMAESLYSGQISAEPVHGSRYPHTCTYCDYQSVCGYENDAPRELDDCKNEEAVSRLQEWAQQQNDEEAKA